MLGIIRRMRARHLFAAWGVWWLLLLLQLTPAFVAMWKSTHAGPGQGNFTITLDGGVISLIVNVTQREIYRGSISFLSLALLIALPPLAMWLAWVSLRPARAPEPERVR